MRPGGAKVKAASLTTMITPKFMSVAEVISSEVELAHRDKGLARN